jgi:hypothetical protein
MFNHRLVIKILWMVPLLVSTLACNAAAQLINSHPSIHFSPTPLPDTTELPTLLTSTINASSEACTALFPDILRSATKDGSHDRSSSADEEKQEIRYLIVYALEGDQLGARDDLLVPADLEVGLDSRAAHESIWNYFASMIPAEERAFVTEFAILSDGTDNVLAGVSPTYQDPTKWTLKVDISDAGDPYSLSYTLLHEFGHFLTLQPDQVPPDSNVFYNPHDETIYEQALATCPRYFTGEGCSNSGSYINEFFIRYWSGIYTEWEQINAVRGQESYRGQLDDFYIKYQDQFLTQYAPTSPEEDIAEAWTFFVLSPRPEPTSMANLKVLFFYDYPELVALREQIRARLCTSFPNP